MAMFGSAKSPTRFNPSLFAELLNDAPPVTLATNGGAALSGSQTMPAPTWGQPGHDIIPGRPDAFGGSTSYQDFQIPGPISGYGGGTFDTQGRPVTLPDAQRELESANATRPKRRGIFGSSFQQPISTTELPPPVPLSIENAPSIAPTGPMPTLSPGNLPKAPGPKFFDKNGAWRDVLGTIGDAIALNQGMQPIYLNTKLANQKALRDHEYRMQELNARLGQLRYFTNGNDRVAYNPRTGESDVIYSGQSKAEDYADTLGLEPGTDEYNTAVQDYILRNGGPTASGFRSDLEEQRQGNRAELESQRQKGREYLSRFRLAGQAELKGRPTYRDAHPTARSGRGGRGSSGGAASYNEGDIVSNAQGKRLQLRGGQWVPVN